MKIASYNTIMKSRKTRRSYAYTALERDYMHDLDGASASFHSFTSGGMSIEDERKWAFREQEYLLLTN